MSKEYTQEELSYLKENYPILDTNYLAIELGRTKGAITTKAYRMGLSKKHRAKEWPLRIRFWEKVNVGTPNECWEWLGFKRESGSGRMTINKEQHSAIKVSWKLNYGEIPDERMVFQICDNISCVNPNHIKLEIQEEKNWRRLWNFVKIEENSDCWEWVGGKTDFGYGTFSILNKNIEAHRYIWSIFNDKEIPDGMCICHHCDNPSCVNPHHLFLGTHKDNVQDMVNKDRQAKGENHGNSILTEYDVYFIRRFCDKFSRKDLANMFGVDRTTIDKIINKELWSHL